jgi:hypothetical protein
MTRLGGCEEASTMADLEQHPVGTESAPADPPDPDEILSVDHYVESVSRSATLIGMPIRLFLRQRVRKTGLPPQGGAKPVLFVHGGTYPSVPDFDLPYQDYSWMAYLAPRLRRLRRRPDGLRAIVAPAHG